MKLPKEIEDIIHTLEEKGFEGYVVGGCVRDILRGVNPEDFDVASNAGPEDVARIFKKSYSDNKFGTVTVFTPSKRENLKEVQVTPYRVESNYKDKRHPEKVEFVENIREDLKRRDFTVNAMALHPREKVIDLFGGREDLEKRVIRAVGNPTERFFEDALRMMRGVRFFATLDFGIEKKTKEAIKENAPLLSKISEERIRDEFLKIIDSEKAKEGVEELRRLGLLERFLPELLEGYQVAQNKHHIYDCYEHAVNALEYATRKKFSRHVRLAALLHDVGKPRVKEGNDKEATFHNHEVVGAKMTRGILRRLKFRKEDIEKVMLLVRYHLFYYNVGEVSESSVRRLLRKVGKENIDELLQVRMADRIGSGVPKAEPYRLRHMRYLIKKVSEDPISVNMLKVGGKDIMEILNTSPGPVIGDILNILLLKVINEPKLNKKESLRKEIEKIKNWDDEKRKEESQRAKKEIESLEVKRDEMNKKKYWVT